MVRKRKHEPWLVCHSLRVSQTWLPEVVLESSSALARLSMLSYLLQEQNQDPALGSITLRFKSNVCGGRCQTALSQILNARVYIRQRKVNAPFLPCLQAQGAQRAGWILLTLRKTDGT